MSWTAYFAQCIGSAAHMAQCIDSVVHDNNMHILYCIESQTGSLHNDLTFINSVVNSLA